MNLAKYHLIIFFVGLKLHTQDFKNPDKNSFFIIPEISIGKTTEANTGFPKRSLQRSLFLSFGKYRAHKNQQWAFELNHPKTGFTFGITDFGNRNKIGIAYTLMPFIEIDLFQKHSDRWKIHVGMGGSYIDRQYDPVTNPLNLAVTTKINWAFRSFLYYDIYKKSHYQWRFGLGYTHFSNGHVQLPNQGLNSFMGSIATAIGNENNEVNNDHIPGIKKNKGFSENSISFRIGIGQNVLSRIYNDKKEVYSAAFSIGKIINKTYKFGVGMYYRFYEHYYDHINENGPLINEQVPEFRKNPFRYATNFGLMGHAELLIGHVGIEFGLGLNIYKPFYKIDWQLSQGFFYNDKYTELGELNWYFKVKRTITSRLGLRYYLLKTNQFVKNNLFIGASLNANLGQADFSEISLGYIYNFNLNKNNKRAP